MNIDASVLATVILPPLGLPLGYMGLNRNFKEWRSYIFCLAFFLATCAYVFEPLDSDLQRYFEFVDYLKRIDYMTAIENGFRGETTLVGFVTLCWIIGRIGDNHLLPAITSFVIYYIGFYVTCKIGEDTKVENREIINYITFIILGLNYFAIINNIRNIFAFSIIGLAVFRECYLKKRNILTWILYIIPMYFHPSAVVVLLLRVILIFARKMKVISFVCVLFINPILSELYGISKSMPDGNKILITIKEAIKKAYYYMNDTSSSWGLIVQKSGSQKMLRVLYISMAIIFCITYIRMYIKMDKESIKLVKEKIVLSDKMMGFAFGSGILTIACAPMLMPEYWRFVSVLILFGGSILLTASKSEQLGLYSFCKCIYLLAPFCTMLWIREFILVNNTTNMIFQPFLSSPLVVFFKDVFIKIGTSYFF